MEKYAFALVLLFVGGFVHASKDETNLNSICTAALKRNKCPDDNFLCSNGKCIKRSWYCDGADDCKDNSDEAYCNYDGECPSTMKKCPSSSKCILKEWFCDDINDCPNGDDEKNCVWKDLNRNQRLANEKALDWLKKKRFENGKWGSSVDRSAVAFHLSSNLSTAEQREIREEMSYGVSIQLLSRLSKGNLKDIPSTDLASYVNAMLVTCLNPRKFHGFDIVGELRSRVDSQNYTDPIVLLALCNAGEIVTESDKSKLIDAFELKRRASWTDVQAITIMALVCASRQNGCVVDSEVLHEMTAELKQHQYKNGTVETLQTTALVLQALLSVGSQKADADDFDVAQALQQILAAQRSNGSFGSFQNTYYVMPVLNCKSLSDIGSGHCGQPRREGSTVLDDLLNRIGSRIRVRYSIWIGNNKDLERDLVFRVPNNTSFYAVMETAKEIDDRFRFEYIMKDRKPYVNALSGLQDDPGKGKFWFIYTFVEGKLTPSQESPADIIPQDNEHIVMWYRSGSWTE